MIFTTSPGEPFCRSSTLFSLDTRVSANFVYVRTETTNKALMTPSLLLFIIYELQLLLNYNVVDFSYQHCFLDDKSRILFEVLVYNSNFETSGNM